MRIAGNLSIGIFRTVIDAVFPTQAVIEDKNLQKIHVFVILKIKNLQK